MYVRCYHHNPFNSCSRFRRHLHQACLKCKFSDLYDNADYSLVHSRISEYYSPSFADNVLSYFNTIEDYI